MNWIKIWILNYNINIYIYIYIYILLYIIRNKYMVSILIVIYFIIEMWSINEYYIKFNFNNILINKILKILFIVLYVLI